MLTDPLNEAGTRQQALNELARLRRFAGPPGEFWPAFIRAAGQLAGSARAILILKDPRRSDQLRKLGEWTANGHADRAVLAFNRVLPSLVERAIAEGALLQKLEETAAPGTGNYAVLASIPLQGGEERCVAAFLLLHAPEEAAREAAVRVQLAADAPFSYQLHFAAQQARSDVEKFASVMDVMVAVNAEKRFLAAAMALCNGLAERHKCDRVSLGWQENGYVRLKVMSRTERFDKQMGAVQALEVTMEECFDQDEEVVWPAVESSNVVVRDHEKFAREQGIGQICSVPLRVDDAPVAVITCERREGAFTAVELQQLRLVADQATRRLSELKETDRWFGARLASETRKKLGKVLGPEHTWAKVFAGLGAVALIILVLPIFNYRVEGNFIVRSDDVAFLTAPFDGYIEEVTAQPGDQLAAQASLLSLDRSDLQLEEAAAWADYNRYLREAEKARAVPDLAEMRISQAQADQAKARLDLVRYRLEQATLRAPFDAVVVEGDLRQRIGAPVQQGEALYRLARLDSLYAEAEVNERDVHEILGKNKGEIAFVTQPGMKFPVEVKRIEPAAFPKEGENVFVVRCEFVGELESWWRPGMSGVCKFDVEDRTLLWILTHRTVDFLRMFFWW